MHSDFERLIEEKVKRDKKERRITALILLLSMGIILIIFFLVANKKKENDVLQSNLNKTKNVLSEQSAITRQLIDTIKVLKEKVECTAKPSKQKLSDGSPLYTFTLKLTDTSLVSQLQKVDYYFNHPSFKPKLRSSLDASANFAFSYLGWGCLDKIDLYLHYKEAAKTDTILFEMCKNTKIVLPSQ